MKGTTMQPERSKWTLARGAGAGLVTAAAALVASAGAGTPVEPPPLTALFDQDLSGFDEVSFTALPGFQAPNWTIDASGLVASQLNNSQPTLFVSDFALDGRTVEVDLSVATTGDGDAVGVALGVEPGDQSNFAARWWLVDWRRTEQTFDFPGGSAGGTATVGLALNEVNGVPSADAFWSHQTVGSNGLAELARGATLGSKGWKPGETYTLRIDLVADRLRLWVDDVLEFDVEGDFTDALAGGRVGLYNFSQSGATYGVRAERIVGLWELYGPGTPGTAGAPSIALSKIPRVGHPILVECGNSSGLESAACLFVTGGAGEVDTLLGTILIDMPLYQLLMLHPFAADGETVAIGVPADPSLAGTELFMQLAVEDAGSRSGYAWSRGLRLVVGE